MSSTPNYKDTLDKMATLQELVATVEQASKTLTNNKANLSKIIGDCNKQIQALQGNIDKIKGQGAQAKAEVQELIKSANERQQSNLNKLKASINNMSNTDALETQLNLLKKDINSIAGTIDTAGTSGGPLVPPGGPSSPFAATRRSSGFGGLSGGYTYGKSRRGKGKRRRRGKNSRKKGRR